MTRTRLIVTLGLLLAAATASAQTPGAPLQDVAREPWRLDPMAVIPLLLLLAWYIRGAWQARGPRGLVGQTEPPVPMARRTLARWGETLCFLGGWSVLAFAFFSPLDSMSRSLFSAHVLQHELMLQLAVPLMVLGRPRAALLQALPSDWSREMVWQIEESRARGLGEMLTQPAVACAIHAVVIWTWAMPAPFEAAMRHGGVHAIQHLSLIGSGILFWWSVLYGSQRPARRRDIGYFLVANAVQRFTLGLVVVASGRLWYPSYLQTTQAWGLAPIEDQQLGAVALWVPAALAAVAVTIALFTGRLRLPGMRPARMPGALVRMARPIVSGAATSDSGAWQH